MRMSKPTMTHAQLRCVAESFRDELARLHSKMDWSDYKTSRITLEVTFQNDKIVWNIQCFPGSEYGSPIKGSDLGVVMDEVYRRLGYEHREEARIESSMVALVAPEPVDE
jgi:hypothetical protein